jgi:hypothetical protein
MARPWCLSLLLFCVSFAQNNRYNYDESKIPPYTLPDPLTLEDGERVKDVKAWIGRRRPELLAVFEDQVYGKTPAERHAARTGPVVADRKALGGKAIRKQVTVFFSPRIDGPQIHLLLYLPSSAKGPVPVFLGLNFGGNQTVDMDPGILTNDVWIKNPGNVKSPGSVKNPGNDNPDGDDQDSAEMVRLPPDDRTRGADAASWQVEKILTAGYGLATMYYYDVEPDFAGGMRYGVRSVLPDPGQWSALGAWAWGLSRAMDYLEGDPGIDPKRIALMGHSRLGKAALWAAAQDQRFALVISNESGKGGASLLKRGYGETADHLNAAFPHWFCANFTQYTGHPEKLPVDGNELLALIAPRPLYVASAEGDQGSDPKGEFLSAADAGRVYALFGKKGLGVTRMPAVNTPVMHEVAYHVRSGRHDVTEYDWDQFLAFAEMQWGKR